MKNNKKKGFTLVELLVVIAILAILATVSVVGYTSFIERAYVSNDQAVADQLTNALVAYKVNANVTNDKELKAAIEDFLGTGYLATMAPQSAQYGYHFWYDIETGEVIAARPKDLGISGLIRPLWKNYASAADDEASEYSKFASGSFRIFGKYYLLDGANEFSKVVEAIKTLENPNMTAEEYDEILNAEVGTKEQALHNQLTENLSSVAIHNQNGIFTNNDDKDTANENVTNVYYPEGVESLAANNNGYVFSNVENADIPSGAVSTTDTLTYLNSDTSINVNVDTNNVEDIKTQVEEQFKTSDIKNNSLTVTITTSDGTELTLKYDAETDTHIIVETDTVKVEVTITPVYSTHLVDFSIFVENYENGKYDIAWDIFATTDKTIKMEAGNFTSDNQNDTTYVPDKSVEWDLNNAPAGVTIDPDGLISGITGPCVFEVQARSGMTDSTGNKVVRTYQIRIGEIVGFNEFKHPNGSSVAFDTTTWIAKIDHEIVSGGNNTFTFVVTPHYDPADVTSCDDTISCNITDGATYSVDNDNNTITVAFTKAGTYTLEVSYEKYSEVKRYIEFNVTNVVNNFELVYMNGKIEVRDPRYSVPFSAVANQTLNMNAIGTTSDNTTENIDNRVTWSCVGPNGDVAIDADGQFKVTAAGDYTITATVDGKTNSFTLSAVTPLRPEITFNGTNAPVDTNSLAALVPNFQMSADNNTYDLTVSVKYSDSTLANPEYDIDVISGDARYDNGRLTINKAGDIKLQITVVDYPELTTVLTIEAKNLVKDVEYSVNSDSDKVIVGNGTITLAPDFNGEFTINPDFTFYHEGEEVNPNITWSVDKPEYIKCLDQYAETGKFQFVSAPPAGTTITITAQPDGLDAKTFTVIFDKLNSFDLGFTGISTGNAGTASTYHHTNTNTIYVAYNHTAPITVNGNNFVYASGSAFTTGVTYSIVSGNAVTLNEATGEFTVNASGDASVATVIRATAKCDSSVYKDFTVKVVKPENAIISIDNTDMAALKDYAVQGGATLTNSMTLELANLPSTKNIAVSDIIYTHGGDAYVSTGLVVDNATFTASSTHFSISGKTLTANSAVEGEAITVTIGDYTGTIYLTLVRNATNPFKVADNADTMTKFDLQLTVARGNDITMDTLFALIDGEDITGKGVVVKAISSTETVILASFTAGAGDAWKSEVLKFTSVNATNNVTIQVEVDGATSDASNFMVNIVEGTNVVDDVSWKAASASKNIVLLKDITFADYEGTDSTGGGIAKNIGSKAIYGNLHKISFGKYIIKVKANNYFITLGGGSINDLIIVGPTYSTLATTQSNGATTGTFVAGVEITGTSTISNSYIYGFRSAVRIDSGTTTINNSVIEGGNYNSIYVYSADKVVLNNSKVVQNRAGYMADGKKVVGIGIFVDTAETNGCTFELKGDTKIYCWVSSSDSYDISNFETYRDYIFDKVDSAYKHGSYINIAIVQEKSSSSSTTISADSSNLNGISYTAATFKAGGIFGIGAKNYGFISVQSHASSGCECLDQIANIPTLDDFYPAEP